MGSDATWKRYIVHVDMDAFYASVEQRDNPQLRGLPVVVGGDPRSRGVVTSASYEARRYGVHSAMPSSHVHKLCRDAIFIFPRFDAYREASRNIMATFYKFTDLVEPMSMDEAFLDISELVTKGGSPQSIAQSIIDRIKENTRLKASAGVSYNKFLAKVGSGINKPNGIKIIPPEASREFLDNLPIRRFYGVGEVTEKKMIDMGILTGADLRPYSKEDLVSIFGRSGIYFHDVIHDIHDPPVKTHHERRSIGKERTLHEDTDNKKEMLDKLSSIADMIEGSMTKRNLLGRTITLRLKYSDRTRISRSYTHPIPTRDRNVMMEHITDMLDRTKAGILSVRLLGIAISNLQKETDRMINYRQSTLDPWMI